jgi:hypothetical protein
MEEFSDHAGVEVWLFMLPLLRVEVDEANT